MNAARRPSRAKWPQATKIPATPAVSMGPTTDGPWPVKTASITWVIPRPITKPHWPPKNPTAELISDIAAIQKNQLAPLRNWFSSLRRSVTAWAAGSTVCWDCMGGPLGSGRPGVVDTRLPGEPSPELAWAARRAKHFGRPRRAPAAGFPGWRWGQGLAEGDEVAELQRALDLDRLGEPLEDWRDHFVGRSAPVVNALSRS